MERADRVRRRIDGEQPVSPEAVLIAIERAIAAQVPVDRWCGLLLDPDTMLPTGGVHDEGVSQERMPRLLELEYAGDDVNAFGDLALGGTSAATLRTATAGDRATSARFRDVLEPDGIGDELRAVFRDGSGPWAALVLMRGSDSSPFTRDDVALVDAIAADVTRAVRRSLLLSSLAGDSSGDAALLLVDVGATVEVRHAGANASRWLDDVADGGERRLPYALHSLARRAHHTRCVEVARLRTRSGRWCTVHAEPLAHDDACVSLILQASRPHEIAPILAAAYGLTSREHEVVRLVAAGCSNVQIARHLGLSRYTVQDHVKRLLDKLDVSSRTELVARLYLDTPAPTA